jgi:hypothetical protein
MLNLVISIRHFPCPSEPLTTLTVRWRIFWLVTLLILVDVHWRFGGVSRLHSQGRLILDGFSLSLPFDLEDGSDHGWATNKPHGVTSQRNVVFCPLLILNRETSFDINWGSVIRKVNAEPDWKDSFSDEWETRILYQHPTWYPLLMLYSKVFWPGDPYYGTPGTCNIIRGYKRALLIWPTSNTAFVITRLRALYALHTVHNWPKKKWNFLELMFSQ